jgi:hypothetical protein
MKMQDVNYNEPLNTLFNEEWKIESEKNGHKVFVSDGLVYKGDFDNKEWNLRNSGNENQLWHNATKRILFLLKDLNDGSEHDVREWGCHAPGKNLSDRFSKNIARWLYGLLNVDKKGIAPDFDSLSDEMITDFFDKTPFARMNCKKQSGGNSISNAELQKHFDLYRDFIKREIEILNPDIVVCGGGSSMLKEFVHKNIYPGLEKINNWVYYDKENNKVVIDSYHPSYWRIKAKSIYVNMMTAYEEFLSKYPEFLKNNDIRTL